jgi:hypothetical protein
MATYYLSACHDCKEQVMWDKCPREQGEEWHKEYTEAFHKGHNTQFDSDYNDEFYDKIFRYMDLGVCDMDEVIEKKRRVNNGTY